MDPWIRSKKVQTRTLTKFLVAPVYKCFKIYDIVWNWSPIQQRTYYQWKENINIVYVKYQLTSQFVQRGCIYLLSCHTNDSLWDCTKQKANKGNNNFNFGSSFLKNSGESSDPSNYRPVSLLPLTTAKYSRI